jgi:DNA-binding MarR family transcriptional regulator
MSTQLPELGCACATLRRAARLVTQLYSQEMGRTVEPAQYTLLSAMSAKPGLNQSRLSAALGLDKTTMSRNLRVMKAYGWIKTAGTGDRRESGYLLTAAGKKTLASAKPKWSSAQAKLRSRLKPGEWEKLFEVLGPVSVAALSDE